MSPVLPPEKKRKEKKRKQKKNKRKRKKCRRSAFNRTTWHVRHILTSSRDPRLHLLVLVSFHLGRHLVFALFHGCSFCRMFLDLHLTFCGDAPKVKYRGERAIRRLKYLQSVKLVRRASHARQILVKVNCCSNILTAKLWVLNDASRR